MLSYRLSTSSFLFVFKKLLKPNSFEVVKCNIADKNFFKGGMLLITCRIIEALASYHFVKK